MEDIPQYKPKQQLQLLILLQASGRRLKRPNFPTGTVLGSTLLSNHGRLLDSETFLDGAMLALQVDST